MRRFVSFLRDQRGATVVEYALICALVILSMIVALNSFAGKVVGQLNNVSNSASVTL